MHKTKLVIPVADGPKEQNRLKAIASHVDDYVHAFDRIRTNLLKQETLLTKLKDKFLAQGALISDDAEKQPALAHSLSRHIEQEIQSNRIEEDFRAAHCLTNGALANEEKIKDRLRLQEVDSYLEKLHSVNQLFGSLPQPTSIIVSSDADQFLADDRHQKTLQTIKTFLIDLPPDLTSDLNGDLAKIQRATHHIRRGVRIGFTLPQKTLSTALIASEQNHDYAADEGRRISHCLGFVGETMRIMDTLARYCENFAGKELAIKSVQEIGTDLKNLVPKGHNFYRPSSLDEAYTWLQHSILSALPLLQRLDGFDQSLPANLSKNIFEGLGSIRISLWDLRHAADPDRYPQVISDWVGSATPPVTGQGMKPMYVPHHV